MEAAAAPVGRPPVTGCPSIQHVMLPETQQLAEIAAASAPQPSSARSLQPRKR